MTSATLAIPTIADLYRILEDHPEWNEALRAKILGKELLALPQHMQNLSAAVEKLTIITEDNSRQIAENSRLIAENGQQIAALRRTAELHEARMDRMERSISDLKGDNAEERVFKNLIALAADADLFEPELLAKQELLEIAQQLHLDRDAQRSFINGDLIFIARNSQGKTTYAAAEVSWTADERDAVRARRNAEFLRQAKGRPAIAIVASHLWDQAVDWNDLHCYPIED